MIFSPFIPILRPVTKSAGTADHDRSKTGFYWFSIESYLPKHNEKNKKIVF